MRNLYLVRHGQVEFADNIRRCIGWTDLPLNDRGRKQGRELGAWFRHMIAEPVPVFASPLARTREMARLLSEGAFPVYEEEGLKELNMGEWENVPMNQLKKTLESWPKTGETRESGLIRIKDTINRILAGTQKDVICVAHAGLNSLLLAHLLGYPLNISRSLPQPCGGFSRILVDGQGNMEVKELGIMPKRAPDDEDCLAIWNHYGTPDHVRRHCLAVCRQAENLTDKLAASGRQMDRAVIRSGALLHDVVRTQKDHSQKGADVVRREGYPAVADVIRYHHDLEWPDALDFSHGSLGLEAAVVYLADKQVQGECAVSIDKRFADSRERCLLAEDRQAALAAHEKRYKQAKKIEAMIQMQIDGGQMT